MPMHPKAHARSHGAASWLAAVTSRVEDCTWPLGSFDGDDFVHEFGHLLFFEAGNYAVLAALVRTLLLPWRIAV